MVIGCGGVGLSVVNGAVLAGAGRVIAVDMLNSKLELARKIGATDAIDASQVDPVAAVMDMTQGGAPFVFEALGLKKTAEQAFAMLRPGGVATILGMFKPGMKLEFDGSMFIKDRRIQGSSMGSNQFRVDIPYLLEYYMQGRLHLDHLISARIPLAASIRPSPICAPARRSGRSSISRLESGAEGVRPYAIRLLLLVPPLHRNRDVCA